MGRTRAVAETRHASAALAVLAALDLGPRSISTICGAVLRTVAFSATALVREG